MPNLNIGQQGTLKSTPKLTKINGDDNAKCIYRNLGNNHAYPFMWATSVTMASGTSSVVLASGIKWHGYDLASYATVVCTPDADMSDKILYLDKDTTSNIITIKSSAAVSADVPINVMCMLGENLTATGLNCRGNDYQTK